MYRSYRYKKSPTTSSTTLLTCLLSDDYFRPANYFFKNLSYNKILIFSTSFWPFFEFSVLIFTFQSRLLFLVCRNVSGQISGFVISVFSMCSFHWIIMACDGPSWGRNWSPLNQHIHRSSLVMIGDLFRSLQEISGELSREIRKSWEFLETKRYVLGYYWYIKTKFSPCLYASSKTVGGG
jgi:hypothetical protein